MAEIVRRRSWGGVLPLGRHVSISGSRFIQCASASIAPPHPGGAKCYPDAEVQGRTGPNEVLDLVLGGAGPEHFRRREVNVLQELCTIEHSCDLHLTSPYC